MKSRLMIAILGIIAACAMVFGTHQSLMVQCETLPVFMETPRNPNLWSCLEIWESQSKQSDINSELEFAQKLKNARDILSKNQDVIPWTGLGVSTIEKAVTISIDDENPEDYREIIEGLVGRDIPVIIKKGGNPFIDSELITGENYCQGWCDNDELSYMGCDKAILAHLAKHSNLLDNEFDGKYAVEEMGLSDGVSVEKFNECVDFIFEKRTSFEFDKTWGGPGNRHPAFLGWDIPDVCTSDMVKFLKKHSSIFDKDMPYMSPLDGDVLDPSVNPDDMVQCENEILENRDDEPSWPGYEN